MKIIILCISSLFVFKTFAQDTIYYDAKRNQLPSSALADYYEIFHRNKKDANKVQVFEYNIDNLIKSEKNYSNYAGKVLDGKYNWYFKSGQLREESNYKDDKKNGNFSTYHQNGKLKRSDEYTMGTLTGGKCFTSAGKDTSYYNYEVESQFPGGTAALNNFLAKEIKYPKEAQKNKIDGRAIVRFVIKPDGSIADLKVMKSAGEELDAEALRVIKSMPKWTPGSLDGVPLNSYYTLPFNFKL
jgi:TonB family protein